MLKEIQHEGKTHIAVDSILFEDIDSDWSEKYSHYWKSPDYRDFRARFNIVDTDGLDSTATFYQGIDQFFVIEEKATGRLFGIPQWQGGGKYGELFRECNGDEFGLESEENPEYAARCDDDDFDEEETPEYIDYWVFVALEKTSFPAYKLA
nr:hypothetical protein [Rhodococcus sp. (in: high G+C Gram-positive bacteria)]